MRRRSDYRFLVLALMWMGIIFWFSNQPRLFYLPTDWLDFLFKKGAHATAYGILWVLWWRALGGRPWWALLITVGYALSDEWHQTFVPGRHGQLLDVGIDTTGALVAMALVRYAQARLHLLQRSPSS